MSEAAKILLGYRDKVENNQLEFFQQFTAQQPQHCKVASTKFTVDGLLVDAMLSGCGLGDDKPFTLQITFSQLDEWVTVLESKTVIERVVRQMHAVPTRRTLVRVIKEQLRENTPATKAGGKVHYGKVALRELLDVIYGGPPAEGEEL